MQTRVVDTHDLVGLVLDHADARTRGGHHRDALAACDDLVADVEQGLGGLLEQTVGLLGQATAALLGHEHLVAQVLEHLDGLHGGLSLEVAAGAALEEDHRALGGLGGRLVLADPLGEGLGVGLGHRGLAVHLDDLLDGEADRLLLEAPVGQRSDRGEHLALEHRERDEAVTQRNTVLVLHLGSGLLVEFGDLHTLRAVQGADAAEVAPLEGVVHRGSVTEPLGLRTVVLRTGVQRGRLGDRTHRLADGALDACVQRGSGGLVARKCLFDDTHDQFLSAAVTPSWAAMASAALIADPNAIPSPDFSCQRVAPAITPPAAKTLV